MFHPFFTVFSSLELFVSMITKSFSANTLLKDSDKRCVCVLVFCVTRLIFTLCPSSNFVTSALNSDTVVTLEYLWPCQRVSFRLVDSLQQEGYITCLSLFSKVLPLCTVKPRQHQLRCTCRYFPETCHEACRARQTDAADLVSEL